MLALSEPMNMSVDFHRAVIRELDQIRAAFERTVEELKKRDESRDDEVSELKLEVGLLRAECRRNLKRDMGLVLAPTTITAIITAVLNWTVAAHPAPAQPTQPQVSQIAPGVP